MIYDVIVVGGGPSGMTAAVYAAGLGAKVCVLEHNGRVGQKILSTGNGKCNLTNMNIDKSCYHSSSAADFYSVIERFTPSDIRKFCMSIGLNTREKNGYVYPYSEQASAVLDALRYELERLKIDVHTSVHITAVKRQTDIFNVRCNDDTYSCKSLVLAGGSKAMSKTGSDGSCYRLAENFGHRIIKVIPALTGIMCSEKYFKELHGVRTEAVITVQVNSKEAEPLTERGELQLAEYGISGIPVFQLCGSIKRLMDKGLKPVVTIDFAPDIGETELCSMMYSVINHNPQINIFNALSGLLNKKIAGAVIKDAGLKPSASCNEISESDILRICGRIKAFKATPVDTRGFEYAQCCAGGVSLDEIDMNTMESKLIAGLYFAGEIMDVDGICGGYNLTWAFASGKLAGSCAADGKAGKY